MRLDRLLETQEAKRALEEEMRRAAAERADIHDLEGAA